LIDEYSSFTYAVYSNEQPDQPNNDCEAVLLELTKEVPFDDDKYVDDQYLELQSDESSTDSTTVQSNSRYGSPFKAIPNLIASVASFVRSVDAKLTYVEHKYGKTLEQLRPHFAWASAECIKATMEASTQLYRATQYSKKLKKHLKSRFPGA
jgi:hypothetical protein